MLLQSYLRKIPVAIGLSVFAFTSAKAQSAEPFIFGKPKAKIANSLYNKINLIDARLDTSTLGLVKTGAFDKKTKLVAAQPLDTQIKELLTAMIDDTAKQQELLLLIRRFSLTEEPGMDQRATAQLRAAMFAKTDAGYQKISEIDSVKKLTAAIDMTDPLLKFGSNIVSDFIAKNLSKEPMSGNYSYNQIAHLDSVEKSRIRVYTAPTYTDGLYENFLSFCLQLPDGEINVENSAIENNTVTTPDKINPSKLKKVKSGNIYAIVSGGKPYIATKFGYYPISKINNELTFTGKISIDASNSSVAASTMMYGAIGGAIGGLIMANSKGSGTYEVILDHTNGSYILMKKIAE